MRWHIVQHSLVTTESHEYGEAQCWAQALGGTAWVGYANAALPADLSAGLNYHPAFACTAHTVADADPVSREVGDYLYLAMQFALACNQHLTPRLSGHDRVVVTYSTQRELFGAAQWLVNLPPDKRPAMCFVFHQPDLLWRVAPDRSQFAGPVATWRHAVNQLRTVLPPSRCMFGATTGRLAKLLGELLLAPVHEVPLVLPLLLDTPPPEKHFDLFMGGGYRPEKGGELWLPVLNTLAPAFSSPVSPLRVAVQVQDAAMEARLRELTNPLGAALALDIVSGRIDTPTQVARLRASRLVVMPYKPDRYALRASGIATEAHMYGIPVVVPAHTGMGDQVLAGKAAGILFDTWDKARIVQSMRVALDQLGPLTSKAALLAPAWQALAGATPLKAQIDTVLN